MAESSFTTAAHQNTRIANPAVAGPAHQAFQLLHIAFVAAPILMGVDKFFNLMVNWELYLSPAIQSAIPFDPSTFLIIVGVIEIAAGVLVALRPKIGGIVVAVWLGSIIINLLLIGSYFDVALRDFGLLLAAVALSRLAAAEGRG